LHFSDVGRARALQELLANRPVAFSEPSVLALHRRWSELVAQERVLSRKLASGVAQEAAGEMQARLAEVTAEREHCERELFQSRWGKVTRPQPPSLRQVHELLQPGETLVEYKVLHGRLVAMAVMRPAAGDDPAPRLRVYETALAPGEERPIWGDAQSVRQEAVLRHLAELQAADGAGIGIAAPDALARSFTIAELVWLYRRPMVLAGASAGGAVDAEGLQGQHLRIAAALYDLLLRPLKADLDAAGIQGLVIVPDGALYYLPFAGLVSHLPAGVDDAPAGRLYAHSELRYAVEELRLSFLPSIAMYAGARAEGGEAAEGKLCAFADPVFVGTAGSGVRGVSGDEVLARLPNSRAEALAALAGFGGGPEELFDDPARVRWDANVGLVSRAASEALLR